MPLIPLQDLHSNPFRDFELYPIDQAQVERLKASIDADGFWASVVARPAAEPRSGYEIAFGHHRIEAARQLGLVSVPIEVRDLDDWQLARMLTSENATQRNLCAAASLDAVQAICRVLAYELLRWDEGRFAQKEASFARQRAKPGTSGIDYARCRGRLEAGSGIGTSCIQAFAPEGSLSEHQIRNNLAALKQSGRMASIIAAAQARADIELQAEREAAEQALAEARALEAAASNQAERREAAKATKAAVREAKQRQRLEDGASKAVASAEAQPLLYDPRCASLFAMETHAETFRTIVTGELFQSYLPLDKQYEFAKTVLARIRDNHPEKKEITTGDIRLGCWNLIESGTKIPKFRLHNSPDRPYKDDVLEGLNRIRRACKDINTGLERLARGLRKGETLTTAQRERLGEHLSGIEADLAAIRNAIPKKLRIVEGS